MPTLDSPHTDFADGRSNGDTRFWGGGVRFGRPQMSQRSPLQWNLVQYSPSEQARLVRDSTSAPRSPACSFHWPMFLTNDDVINYVTCDYL